MRAKSTGADAFGVIATRSAGFSIGENLGTVLEDEKYCIYRQKWRSGWTSVTEYPNL